MFSPYSVTFTCYISPCKTNTKTHEGEITLKKITIAGLGLLGLTVALGLGTGAQAEEIQQDGQTYWKVEAGDTLSAIGSRYGMDYTALQNANQSKIPNAHLIFEGDMVLIPDGTQSPVAQEQAPVVQEQVVEQPVQEYVAPVQEQVVVEQPAQAVQASDDNWHKANRRMVESTNNYNIGSANGYIGAYQFAPSTWNAYAQIAGVNPNDYSPSAQDAVADAYANGRYGGWQNVPTTGGW